MGPLIMLGTLSSLIILIFALVYQLDPEAKSPAPKREHKQ